MESIVVEENDQKKVRNMFKKKQKQKTRFLGDLGDFL
jgi:hypothetical protein